MKRDLYTLEAVTSVSTYLSLDSKHISNELVSSGKYSNFLVRADAQ